MRERVATSEGSWLAMLGRFAEQAQSSTSLESLAEAAVRIAREELPSLSFGIRLDAMWDELDAPGRITVPLEISGRVLGAAYFSADPDAASRARALLGIFSLAASGLLARTRFDHFRRVSALLVSRASIPLAVLDDEDRLEIASRPLGELLGLPVRTRVPLLDLVAPEDQTRLAKAIAEARTSNTSVGPILVRVTAGEREIPLSLELAAIGGPDGTIDGVVILGNDLSDVERLEQQVRHSDRLATIGRLAAGVVHELNNPLSSILAHAEGLLRRATSDGRERGELDRLDRILESADRIRRLTHDLTTYARPSTGNFERLKIESVVDQSLGFCEHVLREAGVTVEKRFGASTSPVFGVRGQLQQVLINLITNACHAMAGGDARLRIETLDTPRGRVEVRLRDSGPGVSVEMRESIFEPFVTSKGEGHGTGLGLSIVRSLLERHDGTVHVEGEAGDGATFVVSLPIARAGERPESNDGFAG